MRWIVLALSFGCPATTPAPTTPTAVAATPTLEATTTCRVSHENGFREWTLDAAGLPKKLYENSDAAGAQWSSVWVRDESGRTTEIQTDMLEGIGDADQTRELSYVELDDGSIEERTDEDGVLRVVRWVYDDEGRPIRREVRVDDEDPRVTTCEYDAAGRVVDRSGDRFDYHGDRAMPHWLRSPGPMPSTQIVSYRGVSWMAEPESPYVYVSFAERFAGDCVDVFFEPCSPVFAPPPPGRARAPRLPALVNAAAGSIEELMTRDLGCTDGDEACTIARVERAEPSETERVEEAALLTIARGPSATESTHLVVRDDAGWWLGPQLADGPFNGNQMSGTLVFRVSNVALRQVVAGGDSELVAHYETETSNEVEERQHDVRESGLIVCLDLVSAARCTRIPEHVRQDIDGEVTEARARLRIVGDERGTIAVEEATGTHERVPARNVPIEWRFDSL